MTAGVGVTGTEPGMIPRYFLTVGERLVQPAVSSLEVIPSPSMYDELLIPLWWTPDGLAFAAECLEVPW
jgi:hypothetical protein